MSREKIKGLWRADVQEHHPRYTDLSSEGNKSTFTGQNCLTCLFVSVFYNQVFHFYCIYSIKNALQCVQASLVVLCDLKLADSSMKSHSYYACMMVHCSSTNACTKVRPVTSSRFKCIIPDFIHKHSQKFQNLRFLHLFEALL